MKKEIKNSGNLFVEITSILTSVKLTEIERVLK